MLSEFAQLDEEHLLFLFAALALLVVGLTAAIGFLACQWRKMRRTKQHLDFKREMIERGLSVDEVERLLEADEPGPLTRCQRATCEIIRRFFDGCRNVCKACIEAAQQYRIRRSELETSLKADLVQRGLSAEEVERIVAARKPGFGQLLMQTLRSLGGKMTAALRTLLRNLHHGLQKLLAPTSY